MKAKVNEFQEMVRARLREQTRNISSLARFLGHQDNSVLYKRLRRGGPALTLEFLDEARAFFQMSVAEMCVLPGALWQEIKPDEVQLLTHFRQLTYTQQQGLLAVLEGRLAQPAKARRAKWGRAELTDEQQQLVDLYIQNEPQAREGILKVLRGGAKRAGAERGQHRTTE